MRPADRFLLAVCVAIGIPAAAIFLTGMLRLVIP